MSTNTYRFAGDTGILHLASGDIACSQFGEQVTLTDEQAVALIASRAPIFSESDFAAFGFSADDLADNPAARQHHLASAEFQKKKQAVVDALVNRILAAQQAKAVSPVAPVQLAPKVFVDVPAVPVVKPATPAPVATSTTKPTEEAK